MNNTIPAVVIVFKTVTLALGAVITYLSYRASQRTGLPGLKLLSLGFGIITLGALGAGVVDQFLSVNGYTALTVESGLTMIGFAVITYSLYATRRAT